jgi:hypothetical protein
MQFFDFYNRQTWHVFQWVTRSGLVDVPALVKQALGNVGQDEWFKMGEDTYRIARDKLAEQLRVVVVNVADEQFGIDVDADYDAIQEQDAAGYTGADALLMPLLCNALGEVVYEAVAEAILRQQSKWAPDNGIPEIL